MSSPLCTPAFAIVRSSATQAPKLSAASRAAIRCELLNAMAGAPAAARSDAPLDLVARRGLADLARRVAATRARPREQVAARATRRVS